MYPIILTHTFLDGCVIGALVGGAIVGTIVTAIYSRREEAEAERTDQRLFDAFRAGENAGVIKGKRESWHEIQARPWQTVAPMHKTGH